MGDMDTKQRERYRFTFSITCDVWASDREEGEKLCRDYFIDDGVPAFIVGWMEAFVDDEREINLDDWNPINDEEEA